ncbi:DegV family protein [Ureaplasma ceti]|uniref:DegV family protein n=1 Tax=Ureaplasma ceti TaxID=3119530 RepID=A0ABP9U9P1_9BACT
MNKKIAFLLDTGSSYKLHESDCFIVPIVINVKEENEEKSYYDEETITRQELVHFLEQKRKVSTSKPVLGMIMDKLDELLETYDMVISIPLSKGLSSTYDTWLTLQKEYGEHRLLVADANTMSVSGNWLVQELKQHLATVDQFDQDDLDELTDSIKQRTCGAVIVTDLSQLIAGGRLKGIKGLLARVLKLNLIIQYKGVLDFKDKDKSLESAIKKTLDIIDSENHFRTKGIKRISIFADLKDPKANETYTKLAQELINTDVPYSEGLLPGCVIMHTGVDTFSILIEANA